MPPAGFESTTPGHELLQTHALDRVATGIGKNYFTKDNIKIELSKKSGPGSVVGIATAYGLDGPGIESRWGEIFRTNPDRP